jgi:hypothetical protein
MMLKLVMMPGHSRFPIGRMILIGLVLVGSATCDSQGPAEEPSSSRRASGSTSIAADPLEGVWSTGPVPVDDIRDAMLAAGLDEEAVEGWIEDQRSPPRFTFELRFDPPNFSHSRFDAHFPLAVDESGTYVYGEGQLHLSLPDLGDQYLFNVTLSDDTLSLELVGQAETGTGENRETHRIYTIALYASAPFSRQS